MKKFCDVKTASRLGIVVLLLAMMRLMAASPYESDWPELSGILSGIKGTWTSNPANVVASGYTAGPLLGNGNVGVTIGSDNTTQTFYIAANDFWTGGYCSWPNCGPRLLATLSITRDGGTGAGGSVSYTQDIMNAQVLSTAVLSSTALSARSWVLSSSTAPEDLLVIELSHNATTPVPLRLQLRTTKKANSMTSPAGSGSDSNKIWISREFSGTATDYGTKGIVALKVLNTSVITGNNNDSTSWLTFTLPANTTCLVAVSIKGGLSYTSLLKTRDQYIADATTRLGQLTKTTIDSMHADHLAWWKEFWLHSYVQTNDAGINNYWYTALYVLGCASRQGHMCPGLFSPWITTDGPSWAGDQHTNYNVENPFFGVYSSNHREVAKAYNDVILGQWPWRQAITRKAGYNGTTFDRYFDSPRGAALYRWSEVTNQPWNTPIAATKSRNLVRETCGGTTDMLSQGLFLAANMINEYYYYQDTVYLNTVYPFFKDLVAFYQDYLVKAANGKYCVYRSASQEDQTNDTNAICDLALVKFSCRALVQMSADLNVDATLRPVWLDIINNMSPYPTVVIPPDTCFKLCDNITTMQHVATGISMDIIDIAMYLGDDVNDNTSLTSIGRNTIRVGNMWHQCNSWATAPVAAAHVAYNPADLYKRLSDDCRTGLRSNLTYAQGCGGIETCGNIEAVDAMLMHSQEGYIELFPAWSPANARFKRLRARGAFLVEAEKKNGVVTTFRVSSEQGKTCIVAKPWATPDLYVYAEGAGSVPTQKSGNNYTFSTTAGATYAISSTQTGVNHAMTDASAHFQMVRHGPLIEVSFPFAGANRIDLWSLNGKKMLSREYRAAGKAAFSIENLPKGCFIVEARSENRILMRQLTIIAGRTDR